MDLSASSTALSVVSFMVLPLVISTWISGDKARAAVRGSHQRWLWGGIYRLGMIGAMIYNAALSVSCLLDGNVQGGVFFAVVFLVWCWFWKKWDHDDDFWNSLGKKAKKLLRQVAGSLRGARTPLGAGAHG
jgi:hypothetical protein